jgi:hypothetical protein
MGCRVSNSDTPVASIRVHSRIMVPYGLGRLNVPVAVMARWVLPRLSRAGVVGGNAAN